MSYIVVWMANHKEPHLSQDTWGFKETFASYEDAKKDSDETVEREGPQSPWYFDYEIYELVEK